MIIGIFVYIGTIGILNSFTKCTSHFIIPQINCTVLYNSRMFTIQCDYDYHENISAIPYKCTRWSTIIYPCAKLLVGPDSLINMNTHTKLLVESESLINMNTYRKLLVEPDSLINMNNHRKLLVEPDSLINIDTHTKLLVESESLINMNTHTKLPVEPDSL